MKKKEEFKKGEIIIYKGKDAPRIDVRLEKNSVWLDTHQIATLFDVKRPAIVKHVGNIYKEGELNEKSTCSILEQVAADGKIRKMNFYNLDMIISVGYRVNSKRATQFRIWATKTLKDHLVKGYTINEKRLKEVKNKFNEFKSAIAFIEEKSKSERAKGQEREILDLIGSYARTLSILESYDKGKLKIPRGKKAEFVLKYEDCLDIVVELKRELIAKKEAGDIFGNEIDKKFESVMGVLYQTFGGKELYKTIGEKAANLLYLVTKGHVFSDGNKRIGAFLFIYFLDKNNYLYKENGEKKINDSALTALALLVAESNPKEKDIIIKIVLNML
jgi:prophage maintenance system killer protein